MRHAKKPPAWTRISLIRSRSASATPHGWMNSPRTRSRYDGCCAKRVTVNPARASTRAMVAPAIPPPTTTMSDIPESTEETLTTYDSLDDLPERFHHRRVRRFTHPSLLEGV